MKLCFLTNICRPNAHTFMYHTNSIKGSVQYACSKSRALFKQLYLLTICRESPSPHTPHHEHHNRGCYNNISHLSRSVESIARTPRGQVLHSTVFAETAMLKKHLHLQLYYSQWNVLDVGGTFCGFQSNRVTARSDVIGFQLPMECSTWWC